MKHEGRGVIRIGDKTSHGGQVVSASSGTVVMGKLAALDGDMSVCPRCKGKFALKPDGAGARHEGKPYAYHDDVTECGARLISTLSQSSEAEQGDGSAPDDSGHDSRDNQRFMFMDAATPSAGGKAKVVRIATDPKVRMEENEESLKHPNISAFLKAVAEAEGGGYDFKYGAVRGKRNDPWRFADMSTHPGPGSGGRSTAAGMYQITIDTWRDHGGKNMGLTDFTPRTQDLIAVDLLRHLGIIDKIKAGDIAGAMSKAAGRWSALPEGPGRPNHYPGQPYVVYGKFLAMYTAAGGAVK